MLFVPVLISDSCWFEITVHLKLRCLGYALDDTTSDDNITIIEDDGLTGGDGPLGFVKEACLGHKDRV